MQKIKIKVPDFFFKKITYKKGQCLPVFREASGTPFFATF
jgi:hypothetical protein